MLSDREREAIERWYAQDKVVDRARALYEDQQDDELEEHLHMLALVPLSRHNELPDFMLDDAGKPLFPGNLNPRADEGKWQDAIEIGWQVMQQKLGFSHDDIHRRIAELQQKDWQEFLARAEQRKKNPA
ncbi:MAG: hypothetical protein ABIJ09_05345 [Pseudomonadota bacterium]